jgi:hypothetical protein
MGKASHPPEGQLEDTPAFARQWDGIAPVRRLYALAYLPQFIGRCRR